MTKTSVQTVEVASNQSGRRLDNFLASVLKNVPKSFIYKIIRRGEVRVNGSRARPELKLLANDLVRIPPLMEALASGRVISAARRTLIEDAIIYEDDKILVIDKPAGIAVHRGSGLRYGAIDIVRELRPQCPGIELAHRLDRDTSGCLVFAKDYPTLRQIQMQIQTPDCRKSYVTLLNGVFSATCQLIELRLATSRAEGEKITTVSRTGKPAATKFKTIESFGDLSLVEAQILTGRTHQIRVHGAASGHPVAGDKKYGDPIVNTNLRKRGLRRMFLHARSITLQLGGSFEEITVEAPLPKELEEFLTELRCAN
ncbi:MAG TPA: hypothetical protein DGR97_06375 [Gammaproteobacteria bacterium]|nr:hypothetical protein [Gammaproteobacteria bacterium]|tara:strand:- start:1874 stop:2812 length:939 start_codon:yes stop_codon:yes gene_type:complete